MFYAFVNIYVFFIIAELQCFTLTFEYYQILEKVGGTPPT